MRLAICVEQTLGHRAHTKNICDALTPSSPDIDVLRIDFRASGRVPLPWAVRGSWDAFRQLRARPRYDATLFHTQSIGLLARQATRGRPYVLSLDATPAQMDSMATWYEHERQPEAVEGGKRRIYGHVLRGASHVVTWSDWAKRSTVEHYGVDAERITVVHPGASRSFFSIERGGSGTSLVPRILFVGGDFHRKGGRTLLQAFETLRGRAELTLVTTADCGVLPPGVTVVSTATPGSAELLDCYRAADIFCLPTLADCTSVAIGEAMAAGLAVVTTAVGSNLETVEDGVTGLLVTPGSVAELSLALERLVDDSELRLKIGNAARLRAAASMDAQANAIRLAGILQAAAT